MKPSPQRLADIGWCAYLVASATCDAQREDADIKADRTHLNGTTLSATWRRGLVALCDHLGIPRKHAKYVNLAFLVTLGGWLYRHIGDHLDSQSADW